MKQADPFSMLRKYSPNVPYEDSGDFSERNTITASLAHTSTHKFPACSVLIFVTWAWEGKRHHSAAAIWLIAFFLRSWTFLFLRQNFSAMHATVLRRYLIDHLFKHCPSQTKLFGTLATYLLMPYTEAQNFPRGVSTWWKKKTKDDLTPLETGTDKTGFYIRE